MFICTSNFPFPWHSARALTHLCASAKLTVVTTDAMISIAVIDICEVCRFLILLYVFLDAMICTSFRKLKVPVAWEYGYGSEETDACPRQ